MKFKKLIIFVSILAILCSAIIPFSVSAETDTVTYSTDIVYSDTSNSGTRHVVCTSTSGTGIADYYTGDNSIYEFASLQGDTLKNALRKFMTNTHNHLSNYNNCRDYATKTDCENNNGRITLIYSSYSATYSEYNGGNGWNREHVWPKSLGGFDKTEAGSDLHHIRPSESVINSTRNNYKYGYATSGKTAIGNLSGLSGGMLKTPYYEPLDNVKGDVARICLYVYVRWGSVFPKSDNLLNVFESIDVLLEWCALDPVDTWEMGRNEVVEAIQGNRNVFIDYPELAWLMFNREIPSNMTTPSGWAKSGSPTGSCSHENTSISNQRIPSCTQMGYTGDIYCTRCNALVSSGKDIPMTSHSFDEGFVTKLPSHMETGILTYTCSGCGVTKTEVLDKNNDHAFENCTPNSDGIYHTGYCICGEKNQSLHSYDDGVATKEATHIETGTMTYTCLDCGYTKTEEIPKIAEHSFDAWAPESDGLNHVRVCICGETEKAEHKFDSGIVTKEATHIEVGTKTFTCSDCGYAITEDIAKLPEHIFSNWTPDGNGSNHIRICACGETEKAEHTFDSGSVTKEATHIEVGIKTYICTVCLYEKNEEISKLPEHTFGNWTSEDDADHAKHCECGETIKEAHKLDNGVITKEATHTELGIKTYTCADCGYTETEDIAKLPEHTFGNWISDDATNHAKHCACGETVKEEHKFNDGTVTKEPTESEKGQKVYICEICKYVKVEAIELENEQNGNGAEGGSCHNPSGSIGLALALLCFMPFIKKMKFML